ncbi:IMPACT family protein [Oribacterium sp. NK2B42]|uniref:IMPACT family protein n=1 Tax=Oribacterium sp. NK2B42 TaxID=689781 RepID=UPI000416620A|nr:YigZ family protein [Oribacterium sp. NK2B42]
MKYIKDYATGEYEEKKSRFIGEVFPIKSEEEAQEHINAVRKKYYDARHHCYAYVIGDNYEIMKQSDDGEPSQTAGMPILNVLKGQDIHDALMIVTRYFGGTLLGTGGLVRSYTNAAKAAIDSAVVLSAVEGYRAEAEIPYTLVGKIKYFTETTGITEAGAEYGNNVKMTWLVPELKLVPFQNHIQEISGGSITLAIEKSRWYNA